MKILFLDDDQIRHQVFDSMILSANSTAQVWHKYNAQETIDSLEAQDFDMILLDHDLGEDLTGKIVATWIAENLAPGPVIVLHSWNFFGRADMEKSLRAAGHDPILSEFGPKLEATMGKLL
jgi:CheY-like chemotaxis protein